LTLLVPLQEGDVACNKSRATNLYLVFLWKTYSYRGLDTVNSPLSAAELFRLPLPPCETRSLNTSSTYLLYSHFNIVWKPSCSNVHFRTFFCS